MPHPQPKATETARQAHPAGANRPKALRNILRDTPAPCPVSRAAAEKAAYEAAIDGWMDGAE